MADKRPVTATLRVIIGGYAAELEASGTIEELLGLARKLEAVGIQPAASPLLGTESAPAQPAANGAAPRCPVHGRPMSRSNYGGWYCTARLDDGAYCKETIR